MRDSHLAAGFGSGSGPDRVICIVPLQAPRFTTSTCLQEVGSPMDTQGSSGTSADLSEKDFHRHADLSIGDLFGKLEEVVEEAGLPEPLQVVALKTKVC